MTARAKLKAILDQGRFSRDEVVRLSSISLRTLSNFLAGQNVRESTLHRISAAVAELLNSVAEPLTPLEEEFLEEHFQASQDDSAEAPTGGQQLPLEAHQVINQLWRDSFGRGLESLWDQSGVFDSPPSSRRKPSSDIVEQVNVKSITDVVDRAAKYLRESVMDPAAHATLLIRDPITDRLIIAYSTNYELLPRGLREPRDVYVSDLGENWDPLDGCLFYGLTDRLASDRDRQGEDAKRLRGLTGWTAVTGEPLLLQSEQMIKNTTISHEVYGAPTWGCRVSEFNTGHPPTARTISSWDARFLAVPVISTLGREVLGVLRFSCHRYSRLISNSDQMFLTSVASLLAAIVNVRRVRVVAERTLTLAYARKALEETGDVGSFLSFVARSTRSRICTAYLSVPTNLSDASDQTKVRLLDGYGLSADVGPIRDHLKDYEPEGGGLTRKIFDDASDSLPRQSLTQSELTPQQEKHEDLGTTFRYSNVAGEEDWKGKNTRAFYKRSLMIAGDEATSEEENRRETLKQFEISLLAKAVIGFEENDASAGERQVLGILKVEMPSTFDVSTHYGPEDQKFLALCSRALAPTLSRYAAFFSTRWFKEKSDKKNARHRCDEFLRIVLQAAKTRLWAGLETGELQRNIEQFCEQHHEALAQGIRQRLPLLLVNYDSVGHFVAELKDLLPESLHAAIDEARAQFRAAANMAAAHGAG